MIFVKPGDSAVRLQDIRRWAVEKLSESGSDTPQADVDWLLTTALGASRASLVAFGEWQVSGEQRLQIEKWIGRRVAGEPLQYIVGHTTFYGLRLKVTPAVLIPRPETEVLVDEARKALSSVRRPRIADIGTGSGCIALALKMALPDSVVEAVDVSADAIAIAQENAASLDLDVSFEHGDLRSEAFCLAPSAYDLVISNPPYVHPSERVELAHEVVAFEPEEALFTDADALEFYRLLVDRCVDALVKGGSLAVEVHAERGQDVVRLFSSALDEVRLVKDLAARDRVVVGTRQ